MVRPGSDDPRSVVVVGAGLAGLATVVALRSRGYAGGLALIGAERHPPYDRPPLSKAVLAGDTDSTELAADWDALDVDLRLGLRATGLGVRTVETESGPLPADVTVLATGADPVRLPGAGQSVLRTAEDALSLRAALRPGARVVIVGAGWIGAEVATAAARAGCATVVVEESSAPLAGALPSDVGARTAGWYAEAGVDLRLGTRVSAVATGAVELVGGGKLPADLVLTGVGVRPATAWLHGSAVTLVPGGGVVTDGGLRTSVPGVFAVGDCAAWESRRYGRRLHVEHWDSALHAPSVVAANILGGEEIYDPVPYFWSEQFGRMVQYAGYHRASDHLVRRVHRVHRDEGARWSVFWLSGNRLLAALTCDRPRDLVQARRLMERDARVDADRLSDPRVPVREAAMP